MIQNRLQFEQIGLATEKPDILTGLLLNNSGTITGDSIMKRISLTQGKFAIVDDCNYEYLNQWKWFAYRGIRTYYASRHIKYNGKTTSISMHREILRLKRGDGKQTDHKNRNGLDNRIENIRVCTRSQNNQNSESWGNSSKYKGVYWHKRRKKWRVETRCNLKRIHIGYYNNEIEAAKAYNAKALEIFGEFAYLNKV